MKNCKQMKCTTETYVSSSKEKETSRNHGYGHIDAQTLKNLIDTKIPMVILDARNQKWDDGSRIPGARSLAFDSSLDTFARIAPHKEALIVVYCGSYECPQGRTLVEKMLAEGYPHILEYAGGMKEWADKMHYSVERKA